MKVRTAGQYARRYAARGERIQRLPRAAVRGQRRANVKRLINAVFGRATDVCQGIPANHADRYQDLGSMFAWGDDPARTGKHTRHGRKEPTAPEEEVHSADTPENTKPEQPTDMTAPIWKEATEAERNSPGH